MNNEDTMKLDYYFKPNYVNLKLKQVSYFNKGIKRLLV